MGSRVPSLRSGFTHHFCFASSCLIDCYTKALPFAKNGIISDVLFAAVFFGIGALVAQLHGEAAAERTRA